TSNGNDFTKGNIEFSIDVNSINTENEQRDNHLKSDDFFNAAKFPKITFKGTSLYKVNGNKYKLKGNFTMRDVTKPIVLDVVYGGTVKDPWGNERVGFKIMGKVNRFDYGLKWNNLVEAGGAVVGKEVTMNCNIELIKKK
ncbi:MAG: YceI family protein, partial [Bacteroidota bacterium]|nr:YceI family protein [Bacteroidota bacterium]